MTQENLELELKTQNSTISISKLHEILNNLGLDKKIEFRQLPGNARQRRPISIERLPRDTLNIQHKETL